MNKNGKYNSKKFGKGKNDEYYTPPEPVKAIQRYNIHKEAVIWCPFDTEYSEFVKLLSRTNKVIFSHKDQGINSGKDFFKYEPDNWDIMISNPPFTNKAHFFERALKLGKPFALLMTVAWLNDARLFKLFLQYKKELQFMWFTERIEFFRDGYATTDRPSFASTFICCDILPVDNVIVNLIDYKNKQQITMFDGFGKINNV